MTGQQNVTGLGNSTGRACWKKNWRSVKTMVSSDLTPTAQATIHVLNSARIEAFDGTLTCSQLIAEVRARYPGAPTRSILLNLEKYGPNGEDDVAWLNQEELTSRFYNPRTGEKVA